jgi:hypothetical protein
MDLTMKNATNITEVKGAPINQFFHARYTTGAKDRMVVRLNVDTMYSMACLDLSKEPLILKKPATETYCSIAILDAYTNCVAILGTGGLDDGASAIYALCGPDIPANIPDEAIRVFVPTNMAWIIVRTAFDGIELSKVHEIQNGFSLMPVSFYGKQDYIQPTGSFDPANEYVPVQKLFSLDIESFFRAFNHLSIANRGTEEDKPALDRFAKVGIGPGLEFQLSDFDEKNREIISSIPTKFMAALIDGGTQLGGTMSNNRVNNWMYPNSDIARFGTNYGFRAAVAITGLGANPVDMCVYPSVSTDQNGDNLKGINNYVLRFEAGMFPPNDAFWSITAYDSDMFLYDNAIDKYAARHTDNFLYNPDGSVDILLQNASPGEHLHGNWLPVPTGDFSLTLRIYRPHQSVLDNTWKPPFVVKVEN